MSDDVIRLIAVGDVFLGEHPYTLNHGVASMSKKQGCQFLFKEIKDQLQDGDIVCANLEGIISPKDEVPSSIQNSIFWGESECAQALKDAGFNVLFLANNHTAQHGKNELKKTCDLLTEKDINWVGVLPDVSGAGPDFRIIKCGNLSVGILAYCDTQQYHLETPILELIDLEKIQRDISELRQQCDFVIVSLHWGDEFITFPSPDQIELGRNIIDSGANLILGHHSHSMQGIEKYNGGVIVYSLGSFTKDLWRKDLREAVIFKCYMSLVDGLEYDLIPTIINENYQPVLYQGNEAIEFNKKINRLSQEVQNYDSGIKPEYGEKYKKKVSLLATMDKLDIIKHYILNIFKYDRRLLKQNIILMIKRRIKRKNL